MTIVPVGSSSCEPVTTIKSSSLLVRSESTGRNHTLIDLLSAQKKGVLQIAVGPSDPLLNPMRCLLYPPTLCSHCCARGWYVLSYFPANISVTHWQMPEIPNNDNGLILLVIDYLMSIICPVVGELNDYLEVIFRKNLSSYFRRECYADLVNNTVQKPKSKIYSLYIAPDVNTEPTVCHWGASLHWHCYLLLSFIAINIDIESKCLHSSSL